MAEGLARARFGDRVAVQSAGSKPSSVSPFAIRAMDEIGIDIRSQRSKSVLEINPFLVDVVVTLCAEKICPAFLETSRKVHWPLPDPCVTAGSTEDILAPFRAIRDETARRLAELEMP